MGAVDARTGRRRPRRRHCAAGHALAGRVSEVLVAAYTQHGPCGGLGTSPARIVQRQRTPGKYASKRSERGGSLCSAQQAHPRACRSPPERNRDRRAATMTRPVAEERGHRVVPSRPGQPGVVERNPLAPLRRARHSHRLRAGIGASLLASRSPGGERTRWAAARTSSAACRRPCRARCNDRRYVRGRSISPITTTGSRGRADVRPPGRTAALGSRVSARPGPARRRSAACAPEQHLVGPDES
jgi:hypothetical protein